MKFVQVSELGKFNVFMKVLLNITIKCFWFMQYSYL